MQEEIGKLKQGLVEEKKKRFNKEIYEETCKDINKYPPHKRTKVGEAPHCAIPQCIGRFASFMPCLIAHGSLLSGRILSRSPNRISETSYKVRVRDGCLRTDLASTEWV